MEPSVATRLDELTPRPSVPYPTIDSVPPVTSPPSESGPEPPIQPRPASPSPRRKHPFWRFLVSSFFVLLIPVAVSWALVFSMNYWTPPRSSYMQIDAKSLPEGETLTYQYVEIDHISRYMIAATIAHEDQVLGTRSGPFEWEDFQKRIDAYRNGEKDPSGSTIPQQLAKNIFLWPAQDPFRKGLEAGLAYELSYSMPPKRLMELYLNYAQFGPHLYGVCAASWYYFQTPPWAMTPEQAALLMGIVPFPSLIKRGPDGGAYVNKETHPRTWDNLNGAANVWVPRQIEGMGGWEAAVATIGIHDLASDYQAERDANPSDPNSCSTWPESVVNRYVQEGLWKN